MLSALSSFRSIDLQKQHRIMIFNVGLTCGLLAALGVAAQPALVQTVLQQQDLEATATARLSTRLIRTVTTTPTITITVMYAADATGVFQTTTTFAHTPVPTLVTSDATLADVDKLIRPEVHGTAVQQVLEPELDLR